MICHPRSLTVLAAFVAMGVGASSASAYQLGGQRWPGRTVTYHTTSRVNAAAVQDAVKAWNTSGVRIKFVPSTRRRAQVIIRTRSQGCVGFAQIGHRGGFGMTLGTGCERRYMALIAAHEFGHVLGLRARRKITTSKEGERKPSKTVAASSGLLVVTPFSPAPFDEGLQPPNER